MKAGVARLTEVEYGRLIRARKHLLQRARMGLPVELVRIDLPPYGRVDEFEPRGDAVTRPAERKSVRCKAPA